MSETLHIRLIAEGWKSHNGPFGPVSFENGRSVRPCTQIEIDRVSALTAVETEDGAPVGIAHRLIGGATIPAPELAPLARQTEAEAALEKASAKTAEQLAAEEQIRPYGVDELQVIADKKGIAGLREVAKPLGVKGRAIAELIEEIVAEQSRRFGKAKAPVEAAPAAPAAAPPAGPSAQDLAYEIAADL